MKKYSMVLLLCLSLIPVASFAATPDSKLDQRDASHAVDCKPKIYFGYSFGFPTFLGLELIARPNQNFELGIGVSPLVYVYEIHAIMNYRFYFRHTKPSSSYLRLGGRVGMAGWDREYFHGSTKFYVTPVLSLGKDQGSNFVQVSVSPGIYSITRKKFKFVPAIVISKGFGF